jgi:hypothetical protein
LAAILDFRYGQPPLEIKSIQANEKLGKFRMIARCLSKQSNFGYGLVVFENNAFDHAFDRRVLFIEWTRKIFWVAANVERHLGESRKQLRQDDVRVIFASSFSRP